MKKIFSFIVFLAGVAMFTSCSKDDTSNPYAHVSSIKIVKADDLSFPSDGGNGNIVFQATGDVTVSSSKEWATATIDGDTVKISVSDNVDKSDRTAKITISCGEDKIFYNILQLGFVFRSSAPSTVGITTNNPRQVRYLIGHSSDITVSTNVDWIETAFRNDSVVIEVTKNETKHIRQGMVYLQSGSFKDSIDVRQGLSSYISNKYYLLVGENPWYDPTDPEDNPYSVVLAHLTGTGSKTKLEFPDYGWTAAGAALETSDLSLSIVPGKIGTYSKYDLALCGWDFAQEVLTWESDQKLSFPMGYVEYGDGSGGNLGYLTDKGTWSEGKFNTISFSAFAGGTLSEDTFAGSLLFFVNPWLEEYDNAEAGSRAAFEEAKRNIQARLRLRR